MFGNNPVTHQREVRRDSGELLVNSVFFTMQGEGPDAGRPAIFVRLAKCNLRCYFCDTEFDTGEWIAPRELLFKIANARRQSHWYHPDYLFHNDCIVVITGGEPLLQNIRPLVDLLNDNDFPVSIETAGTVFLPLLGSLFQPNRSVCGNLIVCSPKTPEISPMIEYSAGAFKYIIRHGEVDPEDGLPTRSTQHKGERQRIFRPNMQDPECAPIYVQPMDEQSTSNNKLNLEAARDSALRYGYRLSIQTHKIVGVP